MDEAEIGDEPSLGRQSQVLLTEPALGYRGILDQEEHFFHLAVGIDHLEAVVARIPAPKGNPDGPLRAMIVDSWFDSYVGVVMLVRVVDGRLAKGERIKMMASGAMYNADNLGAFTPANESRASLEAGEVGYVIAGIRELQAAKVGDTITLIKPGTGGAAFTATEALPGFKEIQPQVFAGLYPTEANQYEGLRDSLEKLKLNDSSLHYEPEVSQALGFGFRCGFLGLLHMEIVQERLEREFDLDLIATAPSVVYQLYMTDGSMRELHNPADMPDPVKIAEIQEPWLRATILTPDEYLGAILKLCQDKRGIQKGIHYITQTRVMIQYELPLAEILLDFNRCILCELCVRAAREVDGKHVFSLAGRGLGKHLIVNAESGRLVDTDQAREEYRFRAQRESYTLTCKRCGAIVPVEPDIVDAFRAEVTARLGVTVITAHSCFIGYCAECTAALTAEDGE